jgi:hypothetical protein
MGERDLIQNPREPRMGARVAGLGLTMPGIINRLIEYERGVTS